MQLSDHCFNVCEALKTAIREENMDDLSEPVRIALEDLGRFVGLHWPIYFPTQQLQGHP